MTPLDLVQARIQRLAAIGQAAGWGLEGQLRVDIQGLEATARTLRGLFRSTTNAALLKPVACGAHAGLALVLAEGNYKDEGSVVSASAVVAAFAEELDCGLLSEADVARLDLRKDNRIVLGNEWLSSRISEAWISPSLAARYPGRAKIAV